MSNSGLAVRYARALYEVAAENDVAAAVSADVAAMERILSEAPQIKRFCLQERDDRATEVAFVEIAFLPYVGAYTGQMIRTAVRNGRIGILPYVPLAYRNIVDRFSEIVRVALEVAQGPEPELVARVQAKMRQRVGRDIRLEVTVVPELIGGMRVSWNNRTIDLSAANRLRQLRVWVKSA